MLTRRLTSLARRLRLQAAARGALGGLVIGLVAALLMLGLSKLTPVPQPLALIGGLALLGTLAGALVAASRRITLLTAAIHADRAAGTDEVISSALEFGADPRVGPLLVARAEQAIASAPAAKLTPKFDGPFPWVATVLALLLVGLWWVPAVTWAGPVGNDPAALAPSVLHALEKSAKEVKKIGDQTENKELMHLGQEMKKLADQARLGEISKKEALAKLADLAEKADRIKKEMAEKKDALAKLEKSPATKELADALAKGDRDGAKSKTDELADKLKSGEMSAEQKQSLKESLDSIAKKSDGELGDAAKEASEALSGGDAKSFGEKMEKLGESLNGARDPRGGGEAAGKQGAQGAAGEKELDGAKDAMADAQDDLEGDGGESSDGNKKEFCEDCGKRKDPSKGG
jgi:hypothetical protein